MFQREHKIFIIKSYCSNGNRGENGNWVYSPGLCLNEFRSENSKVYILDRNGIKIIVDQKTNNLYYVRDIVDKKEETAASTMAGNKNKPSLFSHIKIQMCN
jgi:hypothetical protein